MCGILHFSKTSVEKSIRRRIRNPNKEDEKEVLIETERKEEVGLKEEEKNERISQDRNDKNKRERGNSV